MMAESRNIIHSVDARVIQVNHLDGDQHTLVLDAPEIAESATPGSFVHLGIQAEGHRMRRPLSILWSDQEAGTIEVLYKVVGEGTAGLAHVQEGERLPTLGPIGRGFQFDPDRDRPLLVGGGVGIPPVLFLAREIKEQASPLVVMGSEIPFPFASRPSTIRVPGMPDGVIAGMGLLEDWGVASRLCSTQGYAGCYEGYVDAAARMWLETQTPEQRDRIAVYTCGPVPMLEAVARLAREFSLPCQVCMEEYMACAVGGCAGCTIEVMGEDGMAAKRVCVDGPVFDAQAVFPGETAPYNAD